MYLSRTLLLVVGLLTPAAAQAQTTLRVPVVSRTMFYLPAWTAEQQGFFKQEGLDVKLEVYDTSEKIFHDLRAGSHQIGMASIESVIAESYKGGKLKLVAGIAKRPPHFIVAQPEIKTLADLKGKKIGVVSMHEGTTFFVADIARAGGFKLEDVTVEAVGGSPTPARLLKERKIDMGLQPYPLSYEAEAQGFSNLGPIAKLVPDYQFVSVMVDETWAKANRDVLVRYLRAMRRGMEYMFAHPDSSSGTRRQGAAHQPGVRAPRARRHRRDGHHVARPVAAGREPAPGVRHHAARRCLAARYALRAGEILGRQLSGGEPEVALPMLFETALSIHRHGRACPGHPCLCFDSRN